MAEGLFITVEGVEGSGKTTQARLLADYLRSRELQSIKKMGTQSA